MLLLHCLSVSACAKRLQVRTGFGPGTHPVLTQTCHHCRGICRCIQSKKRTCVSARRMFFSDTGALSPSSSSSSVTSVVSSFSYKSQCTHETSVLNSAACTSLQCAHLLLFVVLLLIFNQVNDLHTHTHTHILECKQRTQVQEHQQYIPEPAPVFSSDALQEAQHWLDWPCQPTEHRSLQAAGKEDNQ